jgi:hypothetical protein
MPIPTKEIAIKIKNHGISIHDESLGTLRILYLCGIEKDELLSWVKAHKQEIIAHIKNEEEEKKKAAEEREVKIAGIDGLRELQEAIGEHEKYHDDFEKCFENEGVVFPDRPKSDVSALRKKYPRAAAYLKAENIKYSDHFVQSAAGSKALEKIIDGEDFKKAIADAKAEFSAYCKEHIWD